MMNVLKVFLRALAVFFIIGGVMGCILGNEIQEINQPYQVQFGCVSNGETVIYDSRDIGGNSSSVNDGEALTVMGCMILVLGAVILIATFFLKGDQNDLDENE